VNDKVTTVITLLLLVPLFSGCISEEVSEENNLSPYLVMDLNPGYFSSNPMLGATLNDSKFIFPASNGNQTKLWISEGSQSTTEVIEDFSIGEVDETEHSLRFSFYLLDDLLFFQVWHPDNHSSLWSTNGNSATLILDINPNYRNDLYRPLVLIDRILILSIQDQFCDYCLSSNDYKYNLDDKTLTMVEDMENIFEFNEEYYYTRDSSMYRLDLSGDIDKLIYDFDPNEESEEEFYWQNIQHLSKQKMVFCLDETTPYFSHYCEEVWTSDGTNSGTQMLFHDNSARTTNSFIEDLVALNGKIFFASGEGLYELYINGTFKIVRDLFPGSSDYLDELYLTDDLMYFIGYDGSYNLYVSDGSFERTIRWDEGLVSPEIVHYENNQIVVSSKDFGMYFFEEDESIKIAETDFEDLVIGVTENHLFLSTDSFSQEFGVEIWAINFR
jgi:ELWxxDGT repeat protein